MEPRRRLRYLGWAVLLLGMVLDAQALAAEQGVSATSAAAGPYEGHTLVSVQSYGLDGKNSGVATSPSTPSEVRSNRQRPTPPSCSPTGSNSRNS